VIEERVARISALADELVAQRAEERIGSKMSVLVDEIGDDGVVGRAAHQGPETDGVVLLRGVDAARGSMVPAVVVDAEGVDLVAEGTGPAW
jgi:tRNA A37 methylthiotransferase MiaB